MEDDNKPFLTAIQDNLQSGFRKVTSGKSNDLTQDEKVHLGVAAGLVTLTTIVIGTYFYRSKSVEKGKDTTNNNNTASPTKAAQDFDSVKKETEFLSTPNNDKSANNTLQNAEEGLLNHPNNMKGEDEENIDEVPLAASPSSDEDQSTTNTSNTAAQEVERRIQAEFEAPASSTTAESNNLIEDPEDEYFSGEEEEEEEKWLDLTDALKLVNELLQALDKFHDERMVEVYGNFVSCLISLQKVFQRFDWGYAEWPDVIAVLNVHAGTKEFDDAWNQLQAKLHSLGFPSIPIFKDDLSREELLKIMREMLEASKMVADSVKSLKTTGDPIIDAHHNFNEKKTRESYEQWRRLVNNEEEFHEVANAATFPNENEVHVPKQVLKEWKDAYLVRVMLNMMTPLTKLQEDNMRKYGIGATHFQNQVWNYGGDSEVADVKHQLEYMMTQIHPTASDTETSNSSSSGSGSDSTY
jgi:hypothetical protein